MADPKQTAHTPRPFAKIGPGAKPRSRYLLPEQRVKWEKRLANWQAQDDESPEPSPDQRAVMWTLLDLKAAEKVNAALVEALEAMLSNGGTSEDEWMPLEIIKQAEAALKAARGE